MQTKKWKNGVGETYYIRLHSTVSMHCNSREPCVHLLDNVPHGNELPCLLAHKQQLLLHCISSRVPVHKWEGRWGRRQGTNRRGEEGGRSMGASYICT